jgi:hypothetical protein
MKAINDKKLIEQYLASHTTTKCPTGIAEGAHDLKYWAVNRSTGRSFNRVRTSLAKTKTRYGRK